MEYLEGVTITVAAKANGKCRFTVKDVTGHEQFIDLTEAAADTLRLGIVSALA
jgi:sulfate adenylyltransferase subunit 1 (EFTu-like GTPase family)